MPVVTSLSTAECERLLRRGRFGRLVLMSPLGPEIVPVNYAVQGDEIVVRVSAASTVARHGTGEVVFEVDRVDEERWHGWSVIARGRGTVGEALTDDVAVGERVRPWVEGDRPYELRLTWTELTGRRVGGR
jgi:hypothetical protein